jgi:hypothetical protein
MNTIHEITGSRYTCFSHLERVEREAQIQAVDYIERMAALTNTDISEVNLFDIFGNGHQKDRLITEKREINKRLNSLMKDEVKSRDLTEIEQELLKKAAKKTLDLKRSRIDTMRNDKAGYMRQAETYYTRYAEYLRYAFDREKEIRALEGRSDMFVVEDIRKILKNKFWNLERLDSVGNPVFITNSDVILEEKNSAMGIDFRVKFGKYKAKLSLDRPDIVVTPCEGNLKRDGYFHPYINQGGSICWGNASEAARKALSNGQYSEVMELLSALLTTYSPSATPYMSLEAFSREDDRGEEDEPSGRCSVCERLEDECSCYFCTQCEELYANAPCSDHYCGVCGTYEYPDCGCCHNCDSRPDDCNCCSICDSSNRDTCGCCTHCDRSQIRLGRDGHSTYCDRPAPETNETATTDEENSF